jgi:hypothetical protein
VGREAIEPACTAHALQVGLGAAQDAMSSAIVTPCTLYEGPLPMRSRAFTGVAA